MASRLRTHEERFAARVDIGPPEQCWLWEGALNLRGYAQFWPYGRAGGKVFAHRYAYERWVDPIPDGLVLDHLCHTNDKTCPGGDECPHRRCVNPWHQEPVTPEVNVRRSRGWVLREDGYWECGKGHVQWNDERKEHLTRIYCRGCFNPTRAEWRRRVGYETPTESAKARKAQRRKASRGEGLVQEGEKLAQHRRRKNMFLGTHPELVDEIERSGMVACAQRIRRGWTFDGREWHRPDE